MSWLNDLQSVETQHHNSLKGELETLRRADQLAQEYVKKLVANVKKLRESLEPFQKYEYCIHDCGTNCVLLYEEVQQAIRTLKETE